MYRLPKLLTEVEREGYLQACLQGCLQGEEVKLTAMQRDLLSTVIALRHTHAALESAATARHSLQQAGIQLLQATRIARQFPGAAASACDLRPVNRASTGPAAWGTGGNAGDDVPTCNAGVVRGVQQASDADGPASALCVLAASGHGQRVLDRLGLSRETQAGMVAMMLRALAREHVGAVQARGRSDRHAAGAGIGADAAAGAGAGVLGVGNWTREHPVLGRGPDGRMDPRSVGVPDVLEMLDEGRVRVMDGVDPSCQGTGTG